MTKDYLAKYVFLESHIKSIRRRLKYFKEHPLMAEHGVVTGSMNQFPYTQCRFVVSGVHVKSDEERKKVVSQLLVDLKGHERLYEDMKLDIESFIENLEDIEEKTILRLKYIDRMTDSQIAEQFNFDRSTISKKIDKILNRTYVSPKSHC